MIRTVETSLGRPIGAREDKPAEWAYGVKQEIFLQRGLPMPEFLKAIPVGTESSPTVKAEANHGRWVAHCPFCPGAELVTPEDKRFLCLSCGNQGRKWLKVEFPTNKQAIEGELLKRPNESNRNWNPRESVADLRAENRRNGIN